MSIYCVEFTTASYPLNVAFFISVMQPSVFCRRRLNNVRMSETFNPSDVFYLKFWKLYGQQTGKITSWIIGAHNRKI